MTESAAAFLTGRKSLPETFTRQIAPGMGQAVAERTVLRVEDGVRETWGDVATRVALGNSMLVTPCHQSFWEANKGRIPHGHGDEEFLALRKHIAKATTLMSGRHLQHGDWEQPDRNMEVFTNCATSPSSFLLFYLLLNGSGVGRCYDDDMMLVDWDLQPNVRCVIDSAHPDYRFDTHETVREDEHK